MNVRRGGWRRSRLKHKHIYLTLTVVGFSVHQPELDPGGEEERRPSDLGDRSFFPPPRSLRPEEAVSSFFRFSFAVLSLDFGLGLEFEFELEVGVACRGKSPSLVFF